MRRNPWYPLALASLGLIIAILAHRVAERAEGPRNPASQTPPLPPEETVADLTPRTTYLSREAAFVGSGPVNDSGYRSYVLLVDKLPCRRERRPEWVQQGRSVWLYDAAGALGRGTVGVPVSAVARGACPDKVELRGVRSRREFLVALPHGHGTGIPSVFRGARAPSDLDGNVPPSLVKEIRSRDAFHASGWRLVDGNVLFAITEEKGPANDESDEEEEGEPTAAAVPALSLGWVDKQGRLKKAASECRRGYVAGALDLNADGRPEVVVDDGRGMSLCRWDGARFLQ